MWLPGSQTADTERATFINYKLSLLREVVLDLKDDDDDDDDDDHLAEHQVNTSQIMVFLTLLCTRVFTQ